MARKSKQTARKTLTKPQKNTIFKLETHFQKTSKNGQTQMTDNMNNGTSGAQLSEYQLSFLNAAQFVINGTQDTWVKTFCESLIEQVHKGRNLSEKQLAIFNKNYDIVANGGPAPIDQSYALDKANKCLGMLGEKDDWNKSFLDSIVQQIQGNRKLSDKQLATLEKIFESKTSQKIKSEVDAVMKPFKVSGKPKVQHDVASVAGLPIFGVCKKCNKEAELNFDGTSCFDCDPLPF